MSIQSNKIVFLSNELNVVKDNILNLTVANVTDAIPAPRMLNEYFGVLNEEELLLYKINSKGLFKKVFSLDEYVLKLDINKFQSAEFGRGSGTLWLQTKYDDKDLVFTSNWKLEGAIKFVNILESKIEIVDRKLLK